MMAKDATRRTPRLVGKSVVQMMKRDAHLAATQLHGLGGTSKQQALRLTKLFAAQRGKPMGRWSPKRHVLRAMALDVMCASFPDNLPPSPELIDLMRVALGLPDGHRVGAEPESLKDGRGKPDNAAREKAFAADRAYLRTHGKLMPVAALAREVKKDRHSVSEWRASDDWAALRAGGK
jgi:hypothetical protein